MKSQLSKLYCCWFYRFFRLFEALPQAGFSNEAKAAFCISWLEVIFIGGLYALYHLMIKQQPVFDLPQKVTFAITCGGVGLANYRYFLAKDRWKQCVKQCRDVSKNKDLKGDIIFWFVNVAIVVFSLAMVQLARQHFSHKSSAYEQIKRNTLRAELSPDFVPNRAFTS